MPAAHLQVQVQDQDFPVLTQPMFFNSIGTACPIAHAMRCPSCGSENQRRFNSEIAIHFSGLSNLHKLPVFVFPELLICLNCGVALFLVPEADLRQIAKTDANPNGQDGH